MATPMPVDPALVTCDFPDCENAVDPAYALMLGTRRCGGKPMLSFCSRSCRSRWIVEFEHQPVSPKEGNEDVRLPA